MIPSGVKIRTLRKARNIRQKQLAELVEMDDTMITKIERGHSLGSVQTLSKLAAALGVDIAELLSDRPAGKPGNNDKGESR